MSTDAPNWKAILAEWQKSGLSQADYCRQNGLKPHRFTYHKKRLAGKTATNDISEIKIAPRRGLSLDFIVEPDGFDFRVKWRF